MRSKDFGEYLSEYFLKYAPRQTGYSINTIKSYRDTFTIFLRYLKDKLKIKPEKLSFEKMSKKMIEEFLLWLEVDKKYSVSTRNQRLAAIHAFFKYVQIESPENLNLCNRILSIPTKKVPDSPISYLTIDAVKALLTAPDMKTKKGRRDVALIALLYDSAARVQEIADLTAGDIILSPATVKLKGKGNKTRIIPIVVQTAKLLGSYLEEYGLLGEESINLPVFSNRNNFKLTRAGISYILSKYAETAKKNWPKLFPKKVSPHILRHSKAMHLLQANVNLIYIRDFLGHSSVITTERYAKADPEIKRKAIEKASYNFLPDKKYSSREKHELLNWLKTII
ncbi:MAG: tyrosine-type recombinase/integrase [Actinobacteria bacterium]|nr:tyrosine-type recombinase/integrase [Actinomycetota bacterium]